MTDATDILPLAADFPKARREEWLKLVARVLKGAPFERALVARTYDGLTVQPLYAGATSAHVEVGRKPGTPWQILQRVDHPDPAVASAQARHDLDNGATGLSLVFAGAISGYGYGVEASETAIAQALEGIALDRVAIELDCAADAEAAARSITAFARQVPSGAANIRFGFDPLGAMAGGAPLSWSAAAQSLGRQIASLVSGAHNGPFAVADGRVIHNAGGSEAQELGFVLAAAIAYLRTLEGTGIALDQARRMIYFRLSADADQFLSIAKLRALRRLWARVEEACGLAPAPILICAETAWRMMTKHDPYANVLRATIAVVAASLGGADAITVLPFTLARGLPDRFARRIARNTQLILAAESHLAKVSDAGAGAGVIEDLTAQLCSAAWTQFQEIEKAGGAAAALEAGLIQKRVAAVAGERQRALATRTDLLTGTSDFADLDEAAVAVLDIGPSVSSPAGATRAALPRLRLAEPFEALRDASDHWLAARGARPRIFLANLGTVADFSPRATFAKSFFEAGGIAAVSNDGFALPSAADGEPKTNTTDLAALVAAFRAAGAKLACLCGSNEVYGREAIAVAKALSEAGAADLYAIGRPAELAGVATFIAPGCDALAILRAAQARIAAQA